MLIQLHVTRRIGGVLHAIVQWLLKALQVSLVVWPTCMTHVWTIGWLEFKTFSGCLFHQCPLSYLETFVHAVGVILSLLLQEGCSHGIYGFECEPDYAETVITALTWNFIESSQATFIVNFSLSLFLWKVLGMTKILKYMKHALVLNS